MMMKLEGYMVRLKLFSLPSAKWEGDVIWPGELHR